MRYSDYLRDEGCVIFLLHGVIRSQTHSVRNYARKHLPLDEFVALLEDLRRYGMAVSMDEVMASGPVRPLPPRAFAITFDDGFENNSSVAAPALDDFGIPATFYVTTGFIDEGSRSWTDLIESTVEAVPIVKIRGLTPEIDGEYVAPTAKRELLDKVRCYVKGNSNVDPYAFAAEMLRQCGLVEAPVDPELDDKLSWRQVRELAEHPLFAVGGHSHTHRILSFLSPDELEIEVATSLRLLREATGAQTPHYSYPEGLAHCYSDAVIDALKRHGVRCCPTAEHGWNAAGDDAFHLRRIFVV